MSLHSLPQEILIIIINKLDLKSIKNLYETGNYYIQHIICVKKFDLSLSPISTARVLKTRFFQNVASHIQELDLKGIQDLSKSKLCTAVKKIHNLVTLNVSYTNITINDFVEIQEKCPSIKNLAIDFRFHKYGSKETYIELDMLSKYCKAFECIQNLQLVGSADNLLDSSMPLNILQRANLNSLTFVLATNEKLFTLCYQYLGYGPINCKNFNVFNLCWRGLKKNICLPCSYSPPLLKYSEYYFIYLHPTPISMYVECSSMFKSFIEENFFLEPIVNSTLGKHLAKNSVCMFWDKRSAIFDEKFFDKLLVKLEPFFPCFRTSDNLEASPLSNDWVCLSYIGQGKAHKIQDEPAFKKRRITKPNVAIYLDNLLHEKEKVEVSIKFSDNLLHPVTLSTSSNFLRKITFLQLSGCIRYSNEFFNILFRCSESLVTLDVEAPPASPCVASIARSALLSSTLKNLRIIAKGVDFNFAFSLLAQCKTLQNLIIIDLSIVQNDLGRPDTLIEQCSNLYYLCVQASMSETARANMLKVYNKIKLYCERWQLYIEVMSHETKYRYNYDPFVSVFKLTRFSPPKSLL